jgi:hypothetical protein
MVRRATSVLVALVCCIFLLPVAAVPAVAAAPSVGTCLLNIQLALNPGLTFPQLLVPTGHGTIRSSGEGLSGTLDCAGIINGGMPTGQGRFGVSGTYQGSCLQGTTSGTAQFEIPTTAGTARGTVLYTVVWIGNVGAITASGANYGFAPGPFDFLPVQGHGDCSPNNPLTLIAWTGLHLVFQS